MAKRIVIFKADGQVLSLSARHGSPASQGAKAEREHVERFLRENAQGAVLALEVQTRRGEDDAILHQSLHRLQVDLHLRPNGTPEVVGLNLTPAIEALDANADANAQRRAMLRARAAAPYSALVGRPRVLRLPGSAA